MVSNGGDHTTILQYGLQRWRQYNTIVSNVGDSTTVRSPTLETVQQYGLQHWRQYNSMVSNVGDKMHVEQGRETYDYRTPLDYRTFEDFNEVR